MKFYLTDKPIEHTKLAEQLYTIDAGALTSFEGRVRNHNHGKKVLSLEYEAYDLHCIKEAEIILREACAKFSIIDCRVSHRTGMLQPGELAVWVGVISSHRDDAFKACRYIIDEIKSRLSVWKKEYYEDGQADWVYCNHTATSSKISV